jgi:hypothetical protein
MDFTLKIYWQLLISLQRQNYTFYSFEEFCLGKAKGKFVILRHDVDLKPEHSLKTAKIENELGIRATYFFLTTKTVFIASIIQQIENFGHEIGYHYRDLVDAKGNAEKALSSFKSNLSLLRSIVPIQTIAMDGCPWSKYDNRDLWKTYNYKEYGLIGEPYFDIDFSTMHYLTDTGRMWDGARYSVRDKIVESPNSRMDSFHSTKQMIQAIEVGSFPKRLMITTHPQRWTDNALEWLLELVLQRLKNRIKQMMIHK